MPFIKILLIITAVIQPSFAWSAPLQALSAGTEVATEGYITLSWSNKAAVNLQVARDQSFHVVLRDINLQGQKQVHLSGFYDGTYYARLLNDEGQLYSNEVSFQVRHRDLRMAWFLFAIGFTLFALMLITLFRFTQKSD